MKYRLLTRNLRLAPFSLLIILLAGCASDGPEIDPLVVHLGKPVSQAISVLGRPTSVHNMQNGTIEYLWTEKVGGGGSSGSFMKFPVYSGKAKTCSRILVTDEQKNVVGFNYEGRCRR